MLGNLVEQAETPALGSYAGGLWAKKCTFIPQREVP